MTIKAQTLIKISRGTRGRANAMLQDALVRLGLRRAPPSMNGGHLAAGGAALGGLGLAGASIANPEAFSDTLGPLQDAIASGLYGLGEKQRSDDWYTADADRARNDAEVQRENASHHPYLGDVRINPPRPILESDNVSHRSWRDNDPAGLDNAIGIINSLGGK